MKKQIYLQKYQQYKEKNNIEKMDKYKEKIRKATLKEYQNTIIKATSNCSSLISFLEKTSIRDSTLNDMKKNLTIFLKKILEFYEAFETEQFGLPVSKLNEVSPFFVLYLKYSELPEFTKLRNKLSTSFVDAEGFYRLDANQNIVEESKTDLEKEFALHFQTLLKLPLFIRDLNKADFNLEGEKETLVLISNINNMMMLFDYIKPFAKCSFSDVLF